jgi:hypothetical protein
MADKYVSAFTHCNQMETDTIIVVGGIYQEICIKPGWCEIYGSAGRAASAIAQAGGKVTLKGYADAAAQEVLGARAAFENFKLELHPHSANATFRYAHGLATPIIDHPKGRLTPLEVSAEKVIRFGMLESDAIVNADYAVYDPQNVAGPEHFASNGSTAKHLALVLNQFEAATLSGLSGTDVLEMAKALAIIEKAEVVIIKLGPQGALVYEKGQSHRVPAFTTNSVWKIGSGDTFVASFALRWMSGATAVDSALYASKSTSFYCENRGFGTPDLMRNYSPAPVVMSDRCLKGYLPAVYLAGPFFTLAQLWQVEEARNQLTALGLKVFSPYHDVGHASAADVAEKDLGAIRQADILFAIADGLDPGTMFEIGYANAINKPVVIYCENESDKDLKMAQGAKCIIVNDYVSAVYKTLWTSISL